MGKIKKNILLSNNDLFPYSWVRKRGFYVIYLKMIFCRVLLPVLWVLAKATCSWGSHFLFQWCCFTSWEKWNDGSILGCLTWLLNLFWEMNRRATPVRNTSAGRPLCFMDPRVLLHRLYHNRFSIWNFCNAAFFHISTINMLTLNRNIQSCFVVWAQRRAVSICAISGTRAHEPELSSLKGKRWNFFRRFVASLPLHCIL